MISIGDIETVLSLRDELTPDLEKVTEKIEESGARIETFAQKVIMAFADVAQAVGEEFEGSGSSLKNWSLGLGAAATAIDGISIATAKMAIGVNSDLANVSALLTDVSDQDLPGITDAMRNTSQEMSVTFGKSTKDMTTALYDVVSSLGYTKDSFQQLEIAAKAGAAGASSTQEAFLGLSAITKAYGDTSAPAFVKAADIMFETVNRGVVTFPQLSAVIGQVGTYAAKLGISLEEVGAVIATTSGVTGTASEVTTQMVSAMTALINPTDRLQNLYKKWGYESGTAAVKGMGFVATLQRIVKETGTNEQELVRLLKRKEAFILTTALAGKQAEDFSIKLKMMETASASAGGTLEKAFARQTQGVNQIGFAWEQFKQKFQVVLEKLGQVSLLIWGPIVNALNGLMSGILSVTNVLTAWPKTLAFVVNGFTMLLRILSLVALAAGFFVGTVGTIIIAFAGLLKSIAVWGLMKVAITWATTALTSYASTVIIAGGSTAAFSLAAGRNFSLIQIAATALMSPIVALRTAFTTLQGAIVAATWTAWIAGGIAALAAGAMLGQELITTGNRLNEFDDYLTKGTEDVNLFSAAWSLLSDAFSSDITFLDNLTEKFPVLGAALFVLLLPVELLEEIWRGWTSLLSLISSSLDKFTFAMYGATDATLKNANITKEWQALQAQNAAVALMAAEQLEDRARSQGLVTEATKFDIKMTDAQIQAYMKNAKEVKLLERVRKELKNETLDLAFATRWDAQQKIFNTGAAVQAEKATAKYKEAVKGLIKEFSNISEATKMQQLLDAFKGIGGAAGMSLPALRDLAKQVDDLVKKGMSIPDAFKFLYDLPKTYEEWRENQAEVNKLLFEQEKILRDNLDTWLETVKVKEEALEAELILFAEQKAASVSAALMQVIALKDVMIEEKKRIEMHIAYLRLLQGTGDMYEKEINQAIEALERLNAKWKNNGKEVETFNEKFLRTVNIISAGIDAAFALGDALTGGFERATNSASALERMFAGGKMGASIGGQIGALFGPIGEAWGKVIGAVVGMTAGLFNTPKWKETGRIAGEILGREVSKELAQQIHDAKFEFGIDADEAALLFISEFMDETGQSAVEMGAQIQALMDGIADGSIPARAGLEDINALFSELVEEAAKGDEAARALVQSLLAVGIASGQLSESMEAFIREAVGKMASGAQKIMEGLALIDPSAMTAEMDAMGTAAAQMFVAGFTAQIAEVGLVQAIIDSGDGITQMYELFEATGNTAAMAMLAPFVQLADVINNEADPSVRGFLLTLQGMSEVFAGLDQLGFVTQDAFDGLTVGIQGTVFALSEAGIVGPQALMAIAPQLAQIIEASERYGFVIDADTQSLIDQANAAGIAFPTDPIQALIALVEQMVLLMGGTLPAASGTARDALTRGANESADAFDRAGVVIETAITGAVESSTIAGAVASDALVGAAVALGVGFVNAGDAISKSLVSAMAESEAAVDPLVTAVTDGIAKLNDLRITIPVTYTGGSLPNIPPYPGGADGDPETPYPAAGGFFSPALPRDQLFQLHKGERVEVTPANETAAGGGSAPPNIYIAVDFNGPRTVSESEWKQISARAAAGLIPIPGRAVKRG